MVVEAGGSFTQSRKVLKQPHSQDLIKPHQRKESIWILARNGVLAAIVISQKHFLGSLPSRPVQVFLATANHRIHPHENHVKNFKP